MAFGEVGHDSGGVTGQTENLFGFGSTGIEGGGVDEAGGGGAKNIAGMEGGGGNRGEAKFFGIERTGVGHSFAGENFGEQSIIGREVDVAGLGADGEGGAIGTDSWIDDGDDDGAWGQSTSRFSKEVRGGGNIESAVLVGEIHNFRGRRDSFDSAFELGDVGIARSEIGKEGDKVAHASRRLASREEREKGEK